MKNLELLKDRFNALNKRGKVITVFTVVVVAIILLDACNG